MGRNPQPISIAEQTMFEIAPRGMTLKRWILGILTFIIVYAVGFSLFSSLTEPQITDRLQLYQTDLLLRTTELSQQADAQSVDSPTRVLLGADPLSSALQKYQQVRESAQSTLEKLQAQRVKQAGMLTRADDAINDASLQNLDGLIHQQQILLTQLDLRIGLLQEGQDRTLAALKTWNRLVEQAPNTLPQVQPLQKTAQVLIALWSDPPQLLPDSEPVIQQYLDGWFRYQGLQRLYELQQRPDAIATLEETEMAIAQKTVGKLLLVTALPIAGVLLGIGFIIFLVAQWLIQGEESLLASFIPPAWETNWTWETIWQVFIFGFFFASQILLPTLFSFLGIRSGQLDGRGLAIYSLASYLSVAAISLTVLFVSIRDYRPWDKDWFCFVRTGRWVLWGFGGYFVAVPLMIGVSLVNQQIWQGQGGSNPLLQIVLEESDPVALGIFFFTASFAAPLFEELLFRGFLLPSLTRYMPVWGAIALSSVIFAIAHLSLSEVLPLSVLGAVLGFVYVRSRSLLAPMLLHGLWNGATMFSLFVLGS
jgi:membrane protease YdiL (CAAX protease family)